MPDIYPQFIKDSAGENLVVLSQREFDTLMEDIEELEDIRLYDEAKKQDGDEKIPAEDAFLSIEAKRNSAS